MGISLVESSNAACVDRLVDCLLHVACVNEIAGFVTLTEGNVDFGLIPDSEVVQCAYRLAASVFIKRVEADTSFGMDGISSGK